MTPELRRLLVSRYPLIFPDGDFPPRSGVGSGWLCLLVQVQRSELPAEGQP